MNPGVSLALTGVWPSADANSTRRSITTGEVSNPSITSTNFINGTGLKKWSPATRAGCADAAAIAVTESDEVFVARMHSLPTTPSRVAIKVCLASSRSTIASITRSASANPAIDSGNAICATAPSPAATESALAHIALPQSTSHVAAVAPLIETIAHRLSAQQPQTTLL